MTATGFYFLFPFDISEGNAFLGIRLLGEGVELTSAKILDLDNNVIEELPLTLVDKKEQFYVTPSFNPPSTIFLVTVSLNLK